MKTAGAPQPAYAILDVLAWQKQRVRNAVAHAGLTPLLATETSLHSVIHTVPEHRLFLIILSNVAPHGLQGYQKTLDLERMLHKEAPTSGIIFLLDDDNQWRPDTLPPLTWAYHTAGLDLAASLGRVNAQKTEKSSAYRECGLVRRMPAQSVPQSVQTRTSCTPNYNIKHPSMLVPFGMASAKAKREIYCEISPQEALAYYDNGNSKSPREQVCHALANVRRFVNETNERLGSQIKLHLDHCDDLYLLEFAAGVGFESVMADGSARGLAQNIIFTQKASHILGGYQVLIEGEVGHIDGHGARRWNRTRADDLADFLSETSVDYVGLHVGQFHGFSYDFQQSRAIYADLQEARHASGDQDWQALLEACLDIDAQLQRDGISRKSKERALISKVAALALNAGVDAPSTVDALLERQMARSGLRLAHLLKELEALWLQRRLTSVNRQSMKWQQLLRSEVKVPATCHARIDLGLLEELCSVAHQHGARPVVHGGSSVDVEDIPLLADSGVARVNFGTQVFRDFLDSLASSHHASARIQLGSWVGCRAFLDEFAENWKDWFDSPPSSMQAFAEHLARTHLARMHSEESTVGMRSMVHQ